MNDKPPTMGAHSFSVSWTYVVPPHNDVRICITQRQDGPFRNDSVGGAGSYHVSRQEIHLGRWEHVPGSSSGAYHNFRQASLAGERQWVDATLLMARRGMGGDL